MAIIKGFQLKAIKKFRGHEGEPLRQANLYFNNKKVGFVSEDAHGGYPIIDVDNTKEWQEVAEEYLAEHPEETTFSPPEFLFYELFDLSENESEFKKAVKKGYTMIAIFDEIVISEYGDVGNFRSTGRQFLIKTTKIADVKNYEKGELKDVLYYKKVFTSLEDFIIT